MTHLLDVADMAYNLQNTGSNHYANTSLMDTNIVLQNMELYDPDSDKHPRDRSEYNH